MSNVTIRIQTPLRSYTGGADEMLGAAFGAGALLLHLGFSHRR